MRIAVPSFVSSALAQGGGWPGPPPRARTRRYAEQLLGASAMQMALVAMTTMMVGIGISIVTTTDAQWWRLHFSQLGTFGNGSALFFNGALIVGGAFVVVFARAAARELRRHEGSHVRRGTAQTSAIFFSVIGISLALVGCVPLHVNNFVHDQFAASMVLGFAGLLLTSPFMMHRMPRRLVLATGGVFVFLFAGAWVFVTGAINLALFEVIAFSAMFGWSGVFLSALAVCARSGASTDVAATTSPVAATVPAVADPAVPPASSDDTAARADVALTLAAEEPSTVAPATIPHAATASLRERRDASRRQAPRSDERAPGRTAHGTERAATHVVARGSLATRRSSDAATGARAARLRPRPSRRPHPRPATRPGARRASHAHPSRGCSRSAARSGSARWRTTDLR